MVPNLWSKTRHVFQGLVDSSEPDEWEAYRDRKYEYKDIEKALKEQFTASLRSFVRLSRAWNVEPILMTQFNRIKSEDFFIKSTYEKTPQVISFNDFVLLYKETNDIVRRVAREEDVYLIDLDSQIPPTKEFIYDGVHLNTNGSKLVAKIITTELKKRYPSIYR